MEKAITGKPQELASNLFLLDKDKVYEIKEYKSLRGTQANRYFHKLVNELARYNRSIGFAISDDEMKIEMNISYGTLAVDDNGKIVGVKVPKGTDIKSFYPYAKKYKEEDNCECYLFYKRTSQLNTLEFTQLIRGVEVRCKAVGIKTLDDIEFEKMMEEYEREYNNGRNNNKIGK